MIISICPPYMHTADNAVYVITVAVSVSIVIAVVLAAGLIIVILQCKCHLKHTEISPEADHYISSVAPSIAISHTQLVMPSYTSEERQPIALIVYSPNTSEKKQELIRGHLITELRLYGIETHSHDLTCIKESPSQWLEREIAKATIVLCVCDKEFKGDWECSQNNTNSLPLVQSLKHLIYATVNQGGDLSKYAVVLLKPTDKDYIPTRYLQGDPRQFMVTDVDAIGRFVCNIPSHVTSSSS